MTLFKLTRLSLIATALLLLCSIAVNAQDKPKQHVYYDTVKTVNMRVEYAPDTIPVYFKEIIISTDGYISEHWRAGFLIWQTFQKGNQFIGLSSSGSLTLSQQPEYYKNDYEFTKGVSGSFLYMDKKPVTNKVFYCLKRSFYATEEKVFKDTVSKPRPPENVKKH